MKNKPYILIRSAVVTLLFILTTLSATAQTNYVFYNSTYGYIYNNNGSLAVSTDFTPAAVWIASGTLGAQNRTISSYTNSSLYLSGGENISVTLTTTSGNATNRWRIKNNVLNYYDRNNGHVKYNNNSKTLTTGNNAGNRFTCYEVTPIEEHSGSPLLTVTIDGYNEIHQVNSPVTIGGRVDGDHYTPAYVTYTFNYNEHRVYNNHDYGYNVPSIYPGDSKLVYEWTVSGTGAQYCTTSSLTGQNLTITYNNDPGFDNVITVRFTVTHPDFPDFELTSEPYDITLYSETINPPTVEREGNSILLSKLASFGTIYYTIDGSDPTNQNNSSRHEYTAPIALVTSPTTIKACTERWSEYSTVSTDTFYIKLDPPVITVSDGTVTISSPASNPAQVSIYYKADDSDETLYQGPFAQGDIYEIKAYIKKTDYLDSDESTWVDEIITGLDGQELIINDLEDHTWTYYSNKPDTDYPDNLRSQDPRNIKITYQGGSVAGSTSSVAISATEDVNTITYYKTIEKKAWGQDEGRWLTGNYAYKVIPNPFSKRPKVGNTYYGFAGWKIVSGGEHINNHRDNDVLDLEEKINFVNLDDGYTPNCTSAEIVFEATWTAATVVRVDANISGDHGLTNGGTYETNFIILSGTNRTISGLTRNATVMACNPDGTSPTGARLSSVTGSGNDLKIENINLGTGGSDFTANTGWLIVGRGCTGTVRRVIGNTGQIKMRIESGTYNFINPMSGGNNNNSNYGLIILGNDYDRATNDGLTSNDQYADNSSRRKLRVINYVSYNGSGAGKSSNDNRDEWMDITIKSGYYGYSADYSLYATGDNAEGFGLSIGGNTDNASSYTAPDINGTSRTYNNLNATANSTTYRWQRLMSFYVGRTRGGNYGGINRLLVEGGELSSINGGGYRNTGANFDVSYHFRMKGGWVKGAIYGTASSSMTSATTKQIITGGEVNGWIAGACNGTDVSNDDGRNEGDTYIYLGGNAQLRSHNSDGVYNNAWGLVGGVEGGNIFASGRGTPATTSNASRNYCGSSYKTYVVVADESEVEQNVCGGGYIGVAQNSHIYITGGQVGNVYGGSMTPTSTNNTWMTQTTDIRQYGGTVKGGIYGGHYQGTGNAGKIHQTTSVQILGGQVGTDASHTANVHGGGFGSGTTVGGNVTVTIGRANSNSTTPVLFGDVYGGSALGTVNTNEQNQTNVTLNAGTINGSLYGGGLGSQSIAANVNGVVAVTVNGGIINTTSANGSGAVYGCNNINGAPQRAVSVTINGTNQAPEDGFYALDAVYGGGNMAAYNGTPTVTVNNCDNSIGYVYGGGNAASVSGTNVTINGGNIIGNVFGGGNGTASAANVNGNAVTNINGGTILHVFGGSNTNGLISGNVTVTINEAANTSCPINITDVYGGGNLAPYSGNPTVSIQRGTVGNAYGGGLGSLAVVTGNTTLTMSGGTVQNLFGGGSEANVTGSVTVNMQGGTVVNDVYGGGALANTNTSSGTTTVSLTGGTMTNAYGGGLGDADHEAKVYGNVQVNLNQNVASGSRGAAVTGNLFGCNNINGTPLGSVTVHVYATQNSNAQRIQDKTNPTFDVAAVYGGGNMAAYKPYSPATATNVIIEGCGFSSIGYVYGGGNAAPVPATNVIIYGSDTIDYVFGGGNGKDKILVDGVLKDNPGADVGIYKVTDDEYDNADPSLYYSDPGHLKGTDKYIMYSDTTGATIIGTTNVTIYGGVVGQLFGGSNTKGDIIKKANVILGDEDLHTCDFRVGGVYGGSNEAYMSGSAGIEMKCVDGMNEIYGGSKKADVNKDIVLTITGGRYGKVFGGNNIGGKVMGSITVNIEQSGCLPIEIGELYGGGNLAPYSVFGYDDNGPLESGTQLYHDPVINVVSCQSIDTIYGGGLKAKMIGSPTININMVKGWTNGQYTGKKPGETDDYAEYKDTPRNFDHIGEIGYVFGGGNQAEVVGQTTVNIGTESTVTVHNITKGVYTAITSGNARTDIENPGFRNNDSNETTKNLTINVEGANITGNIYGGGNNAAVTQGTNINLGPAE